MFVRSLSVDVHVILHSLTETSAPGLYLKKVYHFSCYATINETKDFLQTCYTVKSFQYLLVHNVLYAFSLKNLQDVVNLIKVT